MKISPIKGHKIDQLAVPELKEELERRNLPTQSAKAALIEWLHEALKLEGYNLEDYEDSDLDIGT